jgi:hypothetical protein
MAVLGLLVVMAGGIWWSFESTYGSGLNFVVEATGEDATVYEVDETGNRTSIFEGTAEEAAAYIERRQSEGTNVLLPGLVIGVGALLMLAALIPSRRPLAPTD